MQARLATFTQHRSLARSLLAGMAVGLVAIHLVLVDRIENASLFGNSCLFWGACICLLWQKRREIALMGGSFWAFVGLALLSLSLVKTVAMPTEAALLAFPFFSAFGLALMAAGWRHLQQFTSVLLILFFLGIPQLLLGAAVDISAVTAKVSAFMLWYAGFDVELARVFIHLPGGSIEVYRGCSGLGNMLHMLGISVIFGIFIPLGGYKRLISIFSALLLGFVVNAVRVSLMAVLVAGGDEAAFDYWHLGEGSLVFSLLTVVMFGTMHIWLLKHKANHSQAIHSQVDL